MKQYTYTSYKQSPPEVIFVCEAEGIEEADKKCNAATGLKVDKDNQVGCAIKVL